MMNRRNALSFTGAGLTAALAGITVHAAASAGQSQAAPSEIEALFASWQQTRTDWSWPEDDWANSPYIRLQNQIAAASPTSARDLAIQYYVDSDGFDLDNSDEFVALVARLVGPLS